MNREIGSEFWWDDNIDENMVATALNFINEDNQFYLTSSGRGAISYILNSLKLNSRKALLPAYICESVIIPFEKAGFEISYYQINKDLTPNLDEIIFEFDVILHLGYFGFFTNEKVNSLLSSDHQNFVIEDITHSLFSKKTYGFVSEFKVGSIRKWLGIPGGGFCIGRVVDDKSIPEIGNKFIELRKKALIEKRSYICGESNSQAYLGIFNEAEEILNNDINPYALDEDSKDILNTFNFNQLIFKRRSNYQELLDGLSNINKIEIIFNNLEPDVCPLFFPIYVEDRDSLREYLISKKIFCPVHWPIPPQVHSKLNFTTKNIYENIMSIPCDQRYSKEDMKRIVRSINEWNSQ